jgi:hypothetical protein
MTITQTIEIPASRRITLEVPREVPVGPVILTFTSVKTNAEVEYPQQILSDNLVKSDELKAKLQNLQGSLAKNAFDTLDGVAYQHKVREEWDD